MTNYLIHEGKGHDDDPPGRGSGRYAFGSGKRPFQRMKKSAAPKPTEEEMTAAIRKYNIERQYKKATQGPDKLDKAKNLLNETSNALNRTGNKLRQDQNIKTWERMDLSNMTDQQLRDRINRENLEVQYSKMFNTKTPEVSKGREWVSNAFDIGADVLQVTSSALAIAIAIKALKG